MKAFRYAVFLILVPTAGAYADYYKTYSPQVSEGEFSLEADDNYSADRRPNLDHYLSQVYGGEYGLTSYWQTELAVEIEETADLSMRPTMLKWENIFAPWKPGENWIGVGFYFELEKSLQDDFPNNAETQLLLEKRFGDWINTANISLNREFGPHIVSGIDYGFSWRTKYHVTGLFEPGFEYYSNLGRINRDDKYNLQDNVVGPVIQGHFENLTYDTGVLFGVSQSAHDVTFKLNLEYEF